MRKLCLILLSIGLVMAFSLPAAAADVKFSGSYVAQGTYDHNRKLTDDPEGGSVSSIWQRARIGTEFKVAEGLTFTTRFDALEKRWGATDTTGTDADSANIKFENAFVTFAVPIGTIQAGYMNRGAWGTVLGNNSETDNGARLRYIFVTGPVTLRAVWDKVEGGKGNTAPGTIVEHDSEKFALEGWYKWSAGEAGAQFQYVLDTTNADNPTTGYKRKYYAINPYAKAKFGPVYVEAEFGFAIGKYKEYLLEDVSAGRQDQDISAWRGYVMANVDLKPAYAGALVFYASGDKKDTNDKMEGGVKTGNDFNPCLILMNYDMGNWYGAVGYNASATVANNIDNVFGGQIFAGVKPIPKLDVKVSVTTAEFNENPYNPGTEIVSKDLGYEADLTVAYKIYDNLEYMIGFGYLWAGDAFKGTSAANKVDDDYLVTNKLTLTF